MTLTARVQTGSGAMEIEPLPYALGAEVGTLRVTLEGEKVYEAPLVALTAVTESGFFSRFIDFVYLFFHELFGDE